MTKRLIIATLILLTGYGLIEAHSMVAGPALELVSPTEGAVVTGGIVTISGTALRTAALTLNGAPLLHEGDGDFTTVLALPPGVSVVTITAADRFGKRIAMTRTVFVP